ncbi:MAG TPA: MerR family transcriptional regulator [Metalysinibacillus jejuensis]|uniref:MerR family transcriptional regulator n=1 Tax=Metalysinibacillus jejuensis TaxID=914327 RepID=A0A921NCX7_9BACL|nr:MerR family transcriptional regulator [Metalysinibacillus jejuensis]
MAQYTITQVAAHTGLSKQVIRKWEERYAVVQPERLPNGHRSYSEADVQRLCYVRDLAAQGYTLVEATKQAHLAHQLPPLEHPYVIQLLQYGVQCREVEMQATLQQAHHNMGLTPFLQQVVRPFLRKIGEYWAQGEWSEYQEAAASMVVRDYLVHVRRSFIPQPNAPLLIGACLPGEAHEVPLHIALLHFTMQGCRTFLVGSLPAPGAIEGIVLTLRPQIVLLSATTTRPFTLYPDMLAQLDQFAGEQTARFYLGGAGTKEIGTLQHIQLTNDITTILEGGG